MLSFIKILGLAIGLSTFILGVRYVQFEYSYDQHNIKYDRIYRIQAILKKDRSEVWSQSSIQIANYISKNIPEVETTAVSRYSEQYFSNADNKIFYLKDGCFVTDSYFDIFDFSFKYGKQDGLLANPNSIALSETTANKLFPNENPVGKTLLDEEKKELLITGVFYDIPKNSHVEISYLLPLKTYFKNQYNEWENFSFRAYALLKNNVSLDMANSKVKTILDNNVENSDKDLFLHHLSQLHLQPELQSDFMMVLYLTMGIVILILLLSALNYMNLSTAYSSLRSKEIGVRKVNGGNPNQLRVQYLFESVIQAIFALILAMGIAKMALGAFNTVVNREITLQYFDNGMLTLIVFAIAIITGLLTGLYPAFILSSFKPISVLKGFNPFNKKGGKSHGLKGMVCFQLILSTILIASSVWVFMQVNYLVNKNVGFNKEVLLRCRIPSNNSSISYQALKQQILTHPHITNMSISGNTPLCNSWGTSVYYQGQDATENTYVRNNRANKDFIETYKFELVAGRNFYNNFELDEFSCIINELAVKKSGWTEDPIGKWINIWGANRKVVGVFKNFLASDVHNPIMPYVLMAHNENLQNEASYTFRINPAALSETKKHIQSVFNQVFPNVLFEITTYEDAIDDLSIEIWSSVRNTFVFFTVIAMLITIFGMLSLIVFSVNRRIKEIGVRKVQGATQGSILYEIIKEFLMLLLIADIIVFPVPIILVNTMPGAYKYILQAHDYLLIYGVTFLILLLAGGFNAFKASRMNPVKALRYE